MERAASNYKDGEATGFDRISKTITPDLAYLVEVERLRSKVGGREDVAEASGRQIRLWQDELRARQEPPYPVGPDSLFVAFFVTRFSDRLGRRPLLLWSVVGYTIFTAATALSWDIWSFAFFQFGSRVFLGAEYAIGVTMIVEEYPAARRGRALGVLLTFSALGTIAVGRRSGGSSVMSLPSMRIWPRSGRMNPASIRSVVVLPQPEGPRRATNSRSLIASERSSTAVVSL